MDAPKRKLLFFANSRRQCEAISDQLQAEPSLREIVFTHYSSLSPELRESTEQQFSAANRAICVATSTLEMGIDIGDIDAVVLLEAPSGVESFLQRIGRGNRRSHQTNAICLTLKTNDCVREALIFATLVHLARAGRMPRAGAHQLYGALGQQCLSILQQREGAFTRIQNVADELCAFPYVDRPVIERVLADLAAKGYCQRRGFKNQYGATDALWEMADHNLLFGNFPRGSQTIDLLHGKRLLGTVPQYNLFRARPGLTLRFAGRRWSVKRIDGRGIELEPSKSQHHDIDLSYGGAGRDGLDMFLAQNLWLQLFSISKETCDMDSATWTLVEEQISAIRRACNASSLPCTPIPRGIRYYTFAGSLLNRVLAKWAGRSVISATDLTLEVEEPLDFRRLPMTTVELLPHVQTLMAPSDAQTVFQQQLPLDLQEQEWTESWMKNEEMPQVLRRLQTAGVVNVPYGTFNFIDSAGTGKREGGLRADSL